MSTLSSLLIASLLPLGALVSTALGGELPNSGVPVAAAASPTASGTPGRVAGTSGQRNALGFEVPPERAPSKPRWIADYFDAVDEARRRHCAIVMMISSDASEGFKTVSNQVYSEPDFSALTDAAIFVAAFDGEDHACKEKKIDGEKVLWCEIFDLPCKHHRAAHKRAYSVFVKKAFQNPLHAILDPDGTEIARVQGHQIKLDDLSLALREAQKKIEGPALGYAEYREHLLALREMVDLRQKKGWGRQIKELHKYTAKSLQNEGMQDFVAELERAMLREGRDRLRNAEVQLDAGDAKAARKEVSAVIRDFRDTEVATEARALKKKIEDARRP